MVNNDDFFKGKKPAAVLKHAVFTSYAHPFFSMIGKRHRGPMWFIDGYAGPGRYDADDTGEQVNGSPIVALELAKTQRGFNPPRDVRCAFVEADKTYVKALRNNVKPFQDDGLHAEVHEGSIAQRLPAIWETVAGNPVLTFIDPFGVSAVSKDQMVTMLLAKSRKASSEVLVNINVEAISRHGGYLQWDTHGDPEIRPDLKPHGVERSDTFLGGQWWRRAFLEARDRTGDASKAAMEVVDTYRATIKAETGASSLVVPIRRSPTGAMLFHFTLFYKHPAAAYKFADAAASGAEKWREVFRQKDLEEAVAAEEQQPTLWGDQLAEFSADDAKKREERLLADAVAHIQANIEHLLSTRKSGEGFPVAENIEALLGDYMSLAGEKALRQAWNNLVKAGAVRKRDSKPAELWKHLIVKQ